MFYRLRTLLIVGHPMAFAVSAGSATNQVMRYQFRSLTIFEWLVIIGLTFVLLAVLSPIPFPIDFDAPPPRK